MQKYDDLQSIIALAEFAHHKQLDKAGLPYVEHPKRVLRSVQAQGALPYVQMAAVLHDVVEDTPFTCEMLLELGVPEATVHVVRLLTKVAGEPNEAYYLRIRENAAATMVKLADIEDNTQDWRMAYLPTETRIRLKNKYKKAKAYLNRMEHLPETMW